MQSLERPCFSKNIDGDGFSVAYRLGVNMSVNPLFAAGIFSFSTSVLVDDVGTRFYRKR